MKNFFKRIKKAIDAFKGKEDPKPAPVSQKIELPPNAIAIDMRAFTKKEDVIAELGNVIQKASGIAKEAHIKQNDQIDDYFNRAIDSVIDPFLVSMYRDDKIPIPGLECHIHSFTEPMQGTFGRKIEMKLGLKTIGLATFTARFSGGSYLLEVEEHVKIPKKEKTSP